MFPELKEMIVTNTERFYEPKDRHEPQRQKTTVKILGAGAVERWLSG